MNDKPNNPPTPADFFNWLNQMVAPMANASATMNPNPAMSLDPLTFWKSLLDKNQETYAKFMQQMVGSPEFAKTLGQSANATASYRNMVRQAAKNYLEAANMPSLDDLSQLSEQVVGLDARLDDLTDTVSEDITELLERLVRSMESIGERIISLENRLQTVENIGSRLDKLENQLDQLNAKLDNLTPTNQNAAPRRASRSKKPTVNAVETEMGE